jgi:hypothetical protein
LFLACFPQLFCYASLFVAVNVNFMVAMCWAALTNGNRESCLLRLQCFLPKNSTPGRLPLDMFTSAVCSRRHVVLSVRFECPACRTGRMYSAAECSAMCCRGYTETTVSHTDIRYVRLGPRQLGVYKVFSHFQAGLCPALHLLSSHPRTKWCTSAGGIPKTHESQGAISSGRFQVGEFHRVRPVTAGLCCGGCCCRRCCLRPHPRV